MMTGYRIWTSRQAWSVQGELGLWSISQWENCWQPGVNSAVCKIRPHKPPDETCYCGLWSVSDWHDSVGLVDRSDFILGVIQMWGKIVEHETGYRSEFASPISLARNCGSVPPSDLAKIAQRYDIPLVSVSEMTGRSDYVITPAWFDR
jgi:hypothetical protein